MRDRKREKNESVRVQNNSKGSISFHRLKLTRSWSFLQNICYEIITEKVSIAAIVSMYFGILFFLDIFISINLA
jgi:hypothetical protein